MHAKELATLDVLSAGRVDWGIGAGWLASEYETVGMFFDRPTVRIARMQESVTVMIGAQMMVLIFIVIIIGGLGSVGGCFVGALLVGLVANYVGYLSPKIALGSNILLMVIILLWRPQGLYPMSKQ